MVDVVAYWLAVLTLLTLPSAILYWFLIHPFTPMWRRLGRLPTYVVVLSIFVLVGYGMWHLREPLLRVRFGFNPWLSALAAVLYTISVVIEIRCRKHLKFYILVGAPELSRDAPGKLLDQGIELLPRTDFRIGLG